MTPSAAGSGPIRRVSYVRHTRNRHLPKRWKGPSMRRITILAAGAALLLATAASAQQQAPAPAQSPTASPAPAAPAPESPSTAAPAIKSVNIVDIQELPEATKTQVDTIVAQTS